MKGERPALHIIIAYWLSAGCVRVGAPCFSFRYFLGELQYKVGKLCACIQVDRVDVLAKLYLAAPHFGDIMIVFHDFLINAQLKQ